MVFNDLRSFISSLKERGELTSIDQQVSPRLEITEITDRVVRKEGPALLFQQVKGSDCPVVINLFGSEERMALALGVEELDEVGNRIEELLQLPQRVGGGLMDKMTMLPKLKEMASFPPRRVRRAPVQEVVREGRDVDLGQLPILTCWPEDAGPFITLPMVITRDPSSGQVNMGMYRMQVFDQRTTGMHWHLHKGGAAHYREAKRRGERLEVAVALGGDPATIYSSTAPCPEKIDEFLLAGFLRRKPVELVSATSLDLPVPARAEIVLEGYVDPEEELRREGPFGDHTGYYSLADEYPLFHVTRITHRRDPIYPATVVGRPPMEDYWMGHATERIFVPLSRMVLPEIIDYHLPPEGVFHNLVFVAIDKQYPGHAMKVANGLLGMGLMMLSKVIVILDKEVNVQDVQEAWWVTLNNIDPERDITFLPGPADVLDHASSIPNYGSKMIIDATRKWPEEGFKREWPARVEMDQKTRDRIDELWPQLGIDL